jgi:hypothetical protein
MKILTIGDSWTFGEGSSDPVTKSWPAQMAKKYGVEVTNLARSGCSNQRAFRVCIEEICRNPDYDYIVFPLCCPDRLEVLDHGKWQQIWLNDDTGQTNSKFERFFTELWHPWGDLQNLIMMSFYFMHSIKSMDIPLYMTGLSLHPDLYSKELSWITDYDNDNDFRKISMPLDDLNIGIRDLDRKLKSLRAIHEKNLQVQPEYLNDVISNYFMTAEISAKYGYSYKKFKGHPDDNGYHALCDYFASKIGL